ncbi:MAG: hypothetical protein WKF75_00880 [Singulisphaera sp.]
MAGPGIGPGGGGGVQDRRQLVGLGIVRIAVIRVQPDEESPDPDRPVEDVGLLRGFAGLRSLVVDFAVVVIVLRGNQHLKCVHSLARDSPGGEDLQADEVVFAAVGKLEDETKRSTMGGLGQPLHQPLRRVVAVADQGREQGIRAAWTAIVDEPELGRVATHGRVHTNGTRLSRRTESTANPAEAEYR